MQGYNSFTAVRILRYMAKIEELVKKEFGDTPMNQSKIMLSENEATLSLTKKGFKSKIALLPYDKWND